ncbi:META domain-containing protein [Mucilaginibacter sp. RB4R14]|uniref:META domain-containing protein n=1 Tax=Mucilaginibacter aurantiaciroseus TaxID=2949308 RepID=UPI0020916940|nr:META domain-containing protein [Mucilaginibacter aurantiaciroseus]MCO5936113.1 META domain-containing protein [Mucilaginibacter aurantiaciroseus]
MNKIACFGIILLTVLSCRTAVVPNYQSSNSKTPKVNDFEKVGNAENIYFKSSGTEPFWSLTISDGKIVLKTLNDSLVTPYVEPVLAMDANVKLYRTKTETAQLNIQISQQKCVNEMSGNALPYTVSVEYKKNAISEFEKLKGCGQYVIDYRLNDVWVLEELNGRKITKQDFSKEFPLLEIHASENKFLGFAGCNRMNGSLFFEKEKLLFTNLATTKMMCEPANKEAEFITALQSSNTYQIGNNKLTLSNSSEVKMIFKKID